MFTGIVEEVGRVRSRQGGVLEVEARLAIVDAQLGDSICVNGVCLTLTKIFEGGFAVDTVPETLRRTDLGDLSPGDLVNLERPLAANGRLGGHFVQGHVEMTAAVRTIENDGEALLVRFDAAPEAMRYVVEKGCVAIDGVSLTVVSRDAGSFVVTLIPFTREHTSLGGLLPGERVNIETDILAKYVENLLALQTE